MSYSLLVHILAKHCGLIADEFIYFMGNTHIYSKHIEPLQTQIERTPHSFPKIMVVNSHENIEDYCLEDIIFTEQYSYHDSIKMQMIA